MWFDFVYYGILCLQSNTVAGTVISISAGAATVIFDSNVFRDNDDSAGVAWLSYQIDYSDPLARKNEFIFQNNSFMCGFDNSSEPRTASGYTVSLPSAFGTTIPTYPYEDIKWFNNSFNTACQRIIS